MFINAFTQDRIRDPRKENLPKLTINVQLNYWKKTIYFPKFLIGFMMNRNMNSISCSLCTEKFPFGSSSPLQFFSTVLNFFKSTIFWFTQFPTLDSNKLKRGCWQIRAKCVSNGVWSILFGIPTGFASPTVKSLLWNESSNVDLYLNSHACPITPVQTHRILRLKQINYRLMFHFLSFSPKQSNAKGVVKCK